MPLIDEEMKQYLESEVAAVVGTRDSHMLPESTRGWAIRVHPETQTVEVFLDRPVAGTTVANLRDNGRIAVTCSLPRTHRSVQLKGHCIEIRDPEAGDWAWVDRHHQAFLNGLEVLGYDGAMVRRMWSMQVIKVRFLVEAAFDQTPGPGAGKSL